MSCKFYMDIQRVPFFDFSFKPIKSFLRPKYDTDSVPLETRWNGLYEGESLSLKTSIIILGDISLAILFNSVASACISL